MRCIILVILSWFTSVVVTAQNRPFFGSMYFQHQYLANPAMAGLDSGITVYAVNRQQTSGMDGAPNAQAVAATYQLNGIRFGINAGSNRYGLFNTLVASASVTYSQPLGDNNELLHLGISYGGSSGTIRVKDVEGDVDDPMLQHFNNRKVFYDGDLGLAYTDNRLTVQASVPGFTTAFKKDSEDLNGQMKLYTAVSYAFNISSLPGTKITPQAGYRLLKNNDGVADFGARVNFVQYRFGIEGIYHTNSAATAGVNIAVLPRLSVLCMYSSEPPAVREYARGNMEIGIKAGF